MARFSNVHWDGDGTIQYKDEHGYSCVADLRLLLVREAWDGEFGPAAAEAIEGLADGYGPGAGTHGDWSGIRDSSDKAKAAMLEAALNALFARIGERSSILEAAAATMEAEATTIEAALGVLAKAEAGTKQGFEGKMIPVGRHHMRSPLERQLGEVRARQAAIRALR